MSYRYKVNLKILLNSSSIKIHFNSFKYEQKWKQKFICESNTYAGLKQKNGPKKR